MTRPYRPWTHAEILRLEALRTDGLSARRIAALLGRTRQSAAGKLRELGLTRPRAYAAHYAALTAGRPAGQVAAALGVTARTVETYRTRLRQAGFRVPDGRRRARA